MDNQVELTFMGTPSIRGRIQHLLLPPHSPPSPPQEEASVASPSSDGADLPDDIANQMSLFYANPTPMLNTLSGATSKLLQEVQCVGVGVWVWGCMGGVEMLQEVQCGSIR